MISTKTRLWVYMAFTFGISPDPLAARDTASKFAVNGLVLFLVVFEVHLEFFWAHRLGPIHQLVKGVLFFLGCRFERGGVVLVHEGRCRRHGRGLGGVGTDTGLSAKEFGQERLLFLDGLVIGHCEVGESEVR